MKRLLVAALVCALLLTACGGQEIKELTSEDISNYAAGMSEDPMSGEFTLNGEKMTAPFTVQSLLDKNWNIETEGVDKIPANTMAIVSFRLDNGRAGRENSIYIKMENNTSGEVQIEETEVYELSIECPEGKQNNTLVLPKGITLNSTYDEIIETYGEPKVDYLEDAGFIKYYNSDFNQTNKSIQFEFMDDKQTIEKIILSL